MSKSVCENENPKNRRLTGNLVRRVAEAINEADELAAAERVAKLREKYPHVEPEALVGMLIKQKCLQSGAVGPVTSSASIVPGFGVFISMVFGVAADIGITAKMQAELVLEIAAAYDHELSDVEKRDALIMISGTSSGANELLEKTGIEVSQQATGRIARQPAVNAIPINWLAETTFRSWQLLRDRAAMTTGTVIMVGQSAGEVVVIGADKAGDVAAGAGHGVLWGAGLATVAVTHTARKAGGGLAAGLGKVGEMAAGAGHGLVKSGETAAGAVTSVGRRAGESIATGAGKAAQSTASAGRGVAKGAEAAAGAMAGAGLMAGHGVAIGASKASDLIAEAGLGAIKGVGTAAGVVSVTSKGVAAGAGKIGEMASNAVRRDKKG